MFTSLSFAETSKYMDQIPKDCIYPSSILSNTDIPPINGGFSVVSFHKSPKFPFIVSKKTVHGSFNESLSREFIIPSKFKYPTILRPFGIIDPKDSYQKLQILTEYKSGGTLWDMIQKEKNGKHPINWNSTQKSIVFYGIVKAIDFIHKYNYMHLDLKADNVLLDENLEPFLIDFTCLSNADEKDLEHKIHGNPIFQPPEARQHIFHFESDYYGLGIMRYQMEEMENPFSNEQEHMMIHEKQTGKVFSYKVPGLTANLLNPDPKQRPKPETIAYGMESHLFLFKGTNIGEFDKYVHKLRLREQAMFTYDMSQLETVIAANNGIATAQFIAYHYLDDIEYLINAANQNSILAKTELKYCLFYGKGIAKNIEMALKIPSFIIDDNIFFQTKLMYPDDNFASIYNLASEANDAYLFAEYQVIHPQKSDGLILYLAANIIQESNAYDVYDIARMYLQSYRCGFFPAVDKIIRMMKDRIIRIDIRFIINAANRNSITALQWLFEENMKGLIMAFNRDEALWALDRILELLVAPLDRQFLVEYFYSTNQLNETMKLLTSAYNRTPLENYIYSMILYEGKVIARDDNESLYLLVLSVMGGYHEAGYELRRRYPGRFFMLSMSERAAFPKFLKNII